MLMSSRLHQPTLTIVWLLAAGTVLSRVLLCAVTVGCPRPEFLCPRSGRRRDRRFSCGGATHWAAVTSIASNLRRWRRPRSRRSTLIAAGQRRDCCEPGLTESHYVRLPG